MISIANVLSVTSDDLLCDNIVMAKAQFKKDTALLLEDCSEHEIRIVKDVIASLKKRLRRDAARPAKMLMRIFYCNPIAQAPIA